MDFIAEKIFKFVKPPGICVSKSSVKISTNYFFLDDGDDDDDCCHHIHFLSCNKLLYFFILLPFVYSFFLFLSQAWKIINWKFAIFLFSLSLLYVALFLQHLINYRYFLTVCWAWKSEFFALTAWDNFINGNESMVRRESMGNG